MERISPIWRARLLALGAGLAAGLAHPPFGLLPGLLGYAVLLRLADGAAAGPRPLRSAFLRGWLGGVGYFAISVWWVAEAFLVDARAHGWMAPFAIILLAGGLALFWGASLSVYAMARARGVWRVLVFAGVLSALEWLRGHILSGFPWNLPGETWRAGSAPSQAAALVGAYGLTWITVALAATPAVLFDTAPRRIRALALGVAAGALVLLYAGGAARMAGAPPPRQDAPLVRVAQANIDQKEKWRPENLGLIFQTYVDLTRRPAARRPDVVVWPEGALPAVIDHLLAPGSIYAQRLILALEPGQTLLMGANRAGLGTGDEVDYFNSLVGLRREPEGLRVVGVYDKHQLVPFGEFLPLGELATRMGVRSLVHMPEDFTAGPPPRPFAMPGLPSVQPLICYEALFPGVVRQGAIRSGHRPQWILNISNDAWFGVTSGPLQHLNLASYRAIEEGLPMVRSTPTGVSAVVDAFGRLVPGARIDLSQVGVIDVRLPAAAPSTPYHRYGDLGFAGLLLVSLGFSVANRLRGLAF